MTSEQRLESLLKGVQDMIERNEWRLEDARADATRERETLKSYLDKDENTNDAEMILHHAQRYAEAVQTIVTLEKENRRLVTLATKY